MKIPTIYLETTMFNFPFVDDAPQYKADTLRLFEEIKAGKFQAFTSTYVIDELKNAADSLIEATELVNFREGYRKIGIYSPAEVIDYAENI